MTLDAHSSHSSQSSKPLWRRGYIQVLVAAAAGAAVGAIWPQTGIALKPLADGFINLIKLSITPLIFLVVATGVAQVGDMRKVGRIGLKTLIYFEIITTIALIMGTLVGNAVHFGASVQRPSGTQVAATAQYAGAHAQSLSAFLFAMVPDNLFGAFVHESVLQVLVIALLVGAALLRLGDVGVAIRQGMERCISLVFGVVNIIVMTAPIGAFGALGFTVGRFGIRTLYALGMFVGTAWITLAVLMFVVFGIVCRICGVRILDIMGRLKEELLVVIATSSSEVAIPGMMQKLEASGISRTTLGLVIPTGYSFNLDGVAITIPMSCLFIAQVYGIHLDLRQQITMFVLMLFTSKGAAGVTGGAFAALAVTVIASGLPVEGLALLLGIDRFMSQGRSIVNTVGNAVAAVVVAKWDGDFDQVAWKKYRENLDAGKPTQLLAVAGPGK
jgi:aerobic C4-dicarboxylate transport protein